MEGLSRGAKVASIVGTFLITYPVYLTVGVPFYRDETLRPERTIIVTGATGNLGRALTYHLARRQARVIMACRDMDKCKGLRRELILATKNKGIVCRHLDLEDVDSINRFADEMIKKETHIDVLINNAAIKEEPQKTMTKYGVEKQLFVNFLAPYLLTIRLLDKLEQSAKVTKDSRIVNVTGNPNRNTKIDFSDMNFDTRKYKSKEAHKQSKLALAYFSILLDRNMKMRNNDVYVYAVDIRYKSIYRSLYSPVGLKEEFEQLVEQCTQGGPERAVQIVVKAALDPDIKDRDCTSGSKVWSYWGLPWKWREPATAETEAKWIWNEAYQFFQQLPSPPPPNEASAKTSSKQEPTLTSTPMTHTTTASGGGGGGGSGSVQEQKKA